MRHYGIAERAADHELTTPPRDWPPIDLGLEEDQDEDANADWARLILLGIGIVFAFAVVVSGAILLWLMSMVIQWP
jgi:hypothetical protein